MNKRSNLSFMKAVLPKYFSSEWSFAQFGLPPSAGKTLCAFGSDSHSFVRIPHRRIAHRAHQTLAAIMPSYSTPIPTR